METKANYAVIGLFVIVLTGMMIFGFVWMSGFAHYKSYQTYLVYAGGGVDGLNADSPVQYSGVRVGTVSKIELDNLNPQFVKLYLSIENKIPITQSTVATLIPQGITGLMYVGLKTQTPQAPPLKAENGQSYPVIPFEKPLLTQLSEALPDLTRDVGDIARQLKKLFTERNLENIGETLNHINRVTGLFDKQSGVLRDSLKSLNVFLKNSAMASRHFNATLIAAQAAAAELNKTTAEIHQGLKKADQEIIPEVEGLLMKLNDTAAHLQGLSQDLEKNPAILIRGKQPDPPGPGE